MKRKMSDISSTADQAVPNREPSLREFWLKEDWWAVWLGLGLVIAAYALFASESNIAWIAVAPAKWSTFSELGSGFAANALRYVTQFVIFLVIFTIAITSLGHSVKGFIPAFLFIYILSLAVFAVGTWDQAQRYNLEPPLVALLVGLVISNLFGLPRWLDAGFRVEFYIKTGIVLLGATLPFTLIVWAGPVAILQASIVSVATFLVIFFVGRRLGLDQRLAAVLGAGGAVCGVSAAIAIAGAVRAKKEYPPIAITLVVLWAIVMIFVLPLVSRALQLPAGVAGAWIGTSEFADAAGFAAATTYGKMAGNEDAAIKSFTLMKVIGRDLWIGIWSVVFAGIATFVWEKGQTGRVPDAREIWWRFPKFVIGFFAASILMSAFTSGFNAPDFNSAVRPNVIAPLVSLRTWTFIFCFLSIGLTTRFRDLHIVGWKAF